MESSILSAIHSTKNRVGEVLLLPDTVYAWNMRAVENAQKLRQRLIHPASRISSVYKEEIPVFSMTGIFSALRYDIRRISIINTGISECWIM